jgi:hypothetical protein
VAGVVDLAVVVLQRPDERVGAQRRGDLQRPALGQVAVASHPLVAAQLVVEQRPAADVDALPHPVGQRIQERDRRDEVGADDVEQQAALAQCLADEVELHLLEVAQAAVDELGGAAGGARGKVPRLDQGDRQPPAGGVQRGPRAGRATADDDDVKGLLAESPDRLLALLGPQDRRIGGRAGGGWAGGGRAGGGRAGVGRAGGRMGLDPSIGGY